MAAEGLQHVVEKRHSRSHGYWAAVEIEARLDSGLEGRSGNVCAPLIGSRFGRGHAIGSSVARIASSSSAKIVLSSGVPIETRRQSAMPNAGLPKWRT